MKMHRIGLILLIGTVSCIAVPQICAEEPIQPVFAQYMNEIDLWKRQIVLHRSAEGKLVLIGDCGPEGSAMASDDEGRTWHDWSGIHTWPSINVSAITRRGNELFIHPDDPDLRVYRSKDDGKTWDNGHPFMQWPKLVAIPPSSWGWADIDPNGPRANHSDERYRGKALLWTTPGDRIVVNQEGHLVISIQWLLGGEGRGPELVGSMISEDNGVTWRCYELFGPPQGYHDRPSGFAEPKPVLLSDGRMWLVFRTCLGHLWQAFSEDGGRTWGESSSTELDSPLAPLHAQRVPNNDAVVVVWNYNKPSKHKNRATLPRHPMAFAVSHDHCKSWSRPVIITEQAGYMYNILFSEEEMFITHLEGSGKDTMAKGFKWRHRLVVYDLEDVLALQPKEQE